MHIGGQTHELMCMCEGRKGKKAWLKWEEGVLHPKIQEERRMGGNNTRGRKNNAHRREINKEKGNVAHELRGAMD